MPHDDSAAMSCIRRNSRRNPQLKIVTSQEGSLATIPPWALQWNRQGPVVVYTSSPWCGMLRIIRSRSHTSRAQFSKRDLLFVSFVKHWILNALDFYDSVWTRKGPEEMFFHVSVLVRIRRQWNQLKSCKQECLSANKFNRKYHLTLNRGWGVVGQGSGKVQD